jgi:hypothetical protein
MTEARRFYPNDRWVVDDGFGSLRLGDQVARMALEVDTPFTIGVVGKWGSGKTSVLRRAFATLGGKPLAQAVPLGVDKLEIEAKAWDRWRHNYAQRTPALSWPEHLVGSAKHSLCVWYSPWQHQGAANPLVPLLLEIRAQYDGWTKTKKKASRVVRGALLAGVSLLERAIDAAATLSVGPLEKTSSAQIPIASGTADALVKAFRPADADLVALADGQRFQLLFEDAVETLLAGLDDGPIAQRRLIVFVDDLDRCEEATIVRLLESLKLYLNSRHCVFVLGVDESAVADVLRRHWHGRSEDTNRDYLDKLFQATLPVPLPRAADVRQHAARQFVEHGLPAGASLARMVDELLEPNPRKIKNFVNSLCGLWSTLAPSAPAAGEPVPALATPPADDHSTSADQLARQDCRAADTRGLFAQHLLLFHYLRVHHKHAWRLLERQPWALRTLKHVLLDAPGITRALPDGIDQESQRLMEAVFFQSFAHVLPDHEQVTSRDPATRERHGHLAMSAAVDLILQRVDRKRSDEHFLGWFSALTDGLDAVPQEFLTLSESTS